MSIITKSLKNKKSFIPFITCGDPNLETTEKLIHEAVKNGADLIELGIPFSDPVAEGPVIQAADLRALKSGTTTEKLFDFVKQIRTSVPIPLVFMTYANIVFSSGSEKFIKRCRDVGINGIITPDLPFEESDEFKPFCDKYDIDLISMISPTSQNRIPMIAKEAAGFLYVVSSLGVTGIRNEINTDLESMIKTVREYTDIPCEIGFGISTPEQAEKMSAIADGVIVGSAIVKIVGEYGTQSPEHVGTFIRKMKDAVMKNNY